MTMPRDLAHRWVETAADRDAVAELRWAVYGAELGLFAGRADVWDGYDGHSRLLLAWDAAGPVATGRFTFDGDGPMEIDDVVPWRAALPPGVPRDVPAAEWSRNMVIPRARGRRVLAALWPAFLAEAERRGARLLCGAAEAPLAPLYERFGFTFLPGAAFRVGAFARSPLYLPAYRWISS
jgi:GNAT superfamily N-acetyltransferase